MSARVTSPFGQNEPAVQTGVPPGITPAPAAA